VKYQIAKRFQKDLAKISDQKILTKVRKCIEAVGESTSLSILCKKTSVYRWDKLQ